MVLDFLRQVLGCCKLVSGMNICVEVRVNEEQKVVVVLMCVSVDFSTEL